MAFKRGKPAEPAEKKLSEQVEESVFEEEIEKTEIDPNELIPSGSTLLNCACSDNPHGAYGLGKVVTIPGGSAAGKTILTLTTFAEAARYPRFDKYMFLYDDVEEALEFDMRYLFGPDAAGRVVPPRRDKSGNPIYSNTVQDFQNNILHLTTKDIPFIYVLDSLDALTTDEELEKQYKKALLAAKDPDQIKELKGSYNTEKAKILGQILRMIKGELARTRSTLIIVQQLRQKIGVTFGRKTTTSGGNAPFYYSSHQVWLSRLEKITSKDRKIGSRVKAEVVKNKLTGKERIVDFKVYNDYGVDDISACVDFLIKEKFWKSEPGKAQTFHATGLDITGARPKLIDTIEKNELQFELSSIVGDVWMDIEESIRLTHRKPKYR